MNDICNFLFIFLLTFNNFTGILIITIFSNISILGGKRFMIRTIVINSQKQDREKILSLLSADGDIKVLASGRDGYDAIKLIGSLKPDIAILDNHLGFIKGEDISPVLKLHSPLTSVVILVTRISDYQLFRAASNDVSGFVHKETDMNTLPFILKCIYRGGCFISPALASRVLRLLSMANPENAGKQNFAAIKPRNRLPAKLSVKTLSAEDPTKTLSRMELRILAHIGEGLTSNEIAKKLNLVVGTVRNYISSIMRKTGLHNRSQLARYAFRCGIVPLSPD
jgi:two-component system nitrate/nitrite response regulator NarL